MRGSWGGTPGRAIGVTLEEALCLSSFLFCSFRAAERRVAFPANSGLQWEVPPSPPSLLCVADLSPRHLVASCGPALEPGVVTGPLSSRFSHNRNHLPSTR